MDRFWSKVERDEGCWLWKATPAGNGYGSFWFGKRLRGAHVVAFLLTGQEIPEGHEVHHKCETPLCVNPSHLETKTKRDNVLLNNGLPARNARKTHCPNGHAYDVLTKSGARRCRTCDRAKARARNKK